MFETLISSSQLNQLLGGDNLKIFDTRFYLSDTERGKREYNEAHVESAVYLHLDEDLSGEILPGITGRHPLPDPVLFAEKLRNYGLDNDSQVVIYDEGPGGIAARLWWMLQWLGHKSTAVLNGGWQNWINLNHRTSKKTEGSKKGNFSPNFNSMPLADVHKVEEMVGKENCKIVDSRIYKRYIGEIEPIDPIAGHIPTAMNFPFPENLGEDKFWKSKRELQKRFKDLFSHYRHENIAVYCGSGVTACHNILAMRYADYPAPLLYAGSWSNWITDTTRAIESGDND